MLIRKNCLEVWEFREVIVRRVVGSNLHRRLDWLLAKRFHEPKFAFLRQGNRNRMAGIWPNCRQFQQCLSLKFPFRFDCDVGFGNFWWLNSEFEGRLSWKFYFSLQTRFLACFWVEKAALKWFMKLRSCPFKTWNFSVKNLLFLVLKSSRQYFHPLECLATDWLIKIFRFHLADVSSLSACRDFHARWVDSQ